MKKSKIEFNIELDENKVTEKIEWKASDGGIQNEKAKAIIVSVWDEKTNDTLKIDLWTKEMLVDDMKKFYYQTLKSMADSYQRATDDDKMANNLRDFCAYFKEKELDK